MGHHSSEPVTVSPEQLDHAQHVWGGFVHLSKIGIIGIVIIMGLLGFFFIGLR